MDKKNYRSYPEAFKLEALGVLQKGEKSAGQIERELGHAWSAGEVAGSLSSREKGTASGAFGAQ